MPLAHERLDVYRLAIDFTAWAQQLQHSLPAGLAARNQLERASTSIPLNLAESNGKLTEGERARFLQIALGSLWSARRRWMYWRPRESWKKAN